MTTSLYPKGIESIRCPLGIITSQMHFDNDEIKRDAVEDTKRHGTWKNTNMKAILPIKPRFEESVFIFFSALGVKALQRIICGERIHRNTRK